MFCLPALLLASSRLQVEDMRWIGPTNYVSTNFNGLPTAKITALRGRNVGVLQIRVFEGGEPVVHTVLLTTQADINDSFAEIKITMTSSTGSSPHNVDATGATLGQWNSLANWPQEYNFRKKPGAPVQGIYFSLEVAFRYEGVERLNKPIYIQLANV